MIEHDKSLMQRTLKSRGVSEVVSERIKLGVALLRSVRDQSARDTLATTIAKLSKSEILYRSAWAFRQDNVRNKWAQAGLRVMLSGEGAECGDQDDERAAA